MNISEDMIEITEEMVKHAHRAYMDAPGSHLNGMRAALAAITPQIAAQVIDARIKDIEAVDKAHNDRLIGIPHSGDYSLGLRNAIATLHKCKENYK